MLVLPTAAYALIPLSFSLPRQARVHQEVKNISRAVSIPRLARVRRKSEIHYAGRVNRVEAAMPSSTLLRAAVRHQAKDKRYLTAAPR